MKALRCENEVAWLEVEGERWRLGGSSQERRLLALL
jgi:hypothetical protein